MTALTKKIALTTEIEAALDNGAALFISVSGGNWTWIFAVVAVRIFYLI